MCVVSTHDLPFSALLMSQTGVLHWNHGEGPGQAREWTGQNNHLILKQHARRDDTVSSIQTTSRRLLCRLHYGGLGHSGLPHNALHSSSTNIRTYTCMYSYNSICTYINTQCNTSTDAWVRIIHTYVCMYTI